MSKKRIISIIQGNPMSGSSGSSSEEDSGEDSSPQKRVKKMTDVSQKESKKEKSMDIVELEMRARLIQKALKNDDKPDSPVKIKEEPISESSYSSGSEDDYRRDSKRHRQPKNRRDESESDERSSKKKKKSRISKKEFEDRMRKAKENRSYRKRKDSEDEHDKHQDKKSSRRRKKSPKKASNEGKKPSKDDSEGKKQDDSEKEEGEIDSNEESEEGRYRSYSSDYSSSSSYDSRYSRSRSRSPSKQKKSRHHSRRKRVDMGLIQATLNEPAKKSFPKAKAGIEAVDSEEDFDSPRNGTSKFTEVGTEMVPRADRTNISFSFTKKSHTSVLQGTDLEFGRSSRINKEMPKKADKDQIVISSDSEGEGREKNGDGSINPMMAMDDGANSIIPLSDQSDLKLCEETVMARDILTEIQHDEEDINHDPVIKMENKEEENVVNSSETPAMSSQINNSDMSLQINSSDMSSQINNSDIRIKQEVLEDPAPDPSLTSSTVVKSEPWDEYLANPCEDNPFSSQQTTNTTEVKENLQFQEENLQFQEENQVEVPDAIPPAEDSSEKDHSMAEENETVEDEEDGGGLVDLPENEQDFAIEDDEEENSSKYRMEDLPNRPNVDEESSMMSTFTPSLSDADNSNLLSENLEEAEKLEASENLDEAENLEEAEVSGLVELPPEEAEALTAITSTGGGTDGDSTQNDRNSTQNASAVPGSSWSTRWLQSEKVQKVVSSSRMLSRVRNKIKKDKTLTKRVDSPALEDDSVPVINSMEEYKRVVESSSEQKEAKEPQQEPPPPVVVDESSDEDSQDDELWSKMMGN